MARSTRLFEIIQLLRQAANPVTAAEIADALEVTPRTVYRDMAALQAMRLPILGEAGIGYVMRKGYDLPPLMFNEDEVEAIVVGLAMLGRTGDKGLERAARSAVAKVFEVLPEDGRRSVPLQVSQWTRIPDLGGRVADLRRAIRDAEEIEIDYLDLEGRHSERAIKPVAMVYYVDSVVLAAWCLLREAFRHFRADRIVAYRRTGATFADAAAALRHAWEQEQSE